jgi:hypothetical protein
VRLESIAELYALGDCFAVGGEGHPRVTYAQWDAINALIGTTSANRYSHTHDKLRTFLRRRARMCQRVPSSTRRF